MRKSHYIKGSSCEKYLYKLYSNLRNRLKRHAKRLYYHNQVNACKGNPKKTWDNLRSLLPNKSISSATHSLSINGEIVILPPFWKNLIPTFQILDSPWQLALLTTVISMIFIHTSNLRALPLFISTQRPLRKSLNLFTTWTQTKLVVLMIFHHLF